MALILRFVAFFGPALVLKLGVEVKSGVGVGFGQDRQFCLKIGEFRPANVADVKKVRPRPHSHQFAVHHLEGIRVFAHFPARQVLAVEQFHKSAVILGQRSGGREKTEREEEFWQVS